MSDNYLERLERHLKAYREDDDATIIDNPMAYRWLTVGDQRAAVAELKQLQAEAVDLRAIRDSRVREVRVAFAAGWAERGVITAQRLSTSIDERETAGQAYAATRIADWHESAPQQPAHNTAHSASGAEAKFATELERLRKNDPTGAQWLENLLAERAQNPVASTQDNGQQAENDKTTCAFSDCIHPDHQRAADSDGGAE